MTNISSQTQPWLKPEKWNVSPYNFADKVRARWKLPEKVYICDSTLRDGEQTPGVVFTVEEKLAIARYLDEIGVPRIEGGMPAVSADDAKALRLIVKESKNAKVTCLARTQKQDIDLAIGCDAWGINMEIPAREKEVEQIWGTVEDATLSMVELITYAREHGLHVTLFPVDMTRATMAEIRRIIVPASSEAKVDGLVIADTTGCCVPEAVVYLIEELRKLVDIPLEGHFHNTLGCATANSLAAITQGVKYIHTTVNGLGANSALEEIVFGSHAILGVDTGINTTEFYKLSQVVKKASGANWYKPLVGESVGLVEVGIRTKLIWEDPRGMKGGIERGMMNPQVIGRELRIGLGKKSGRHSIMLQAKVMGLPIPSQAQTDEILANVKELSISKKRLISQEEFREKYRSVMKEHSEM